MAAAGESAFSVLDVDLPCCGAQGNLNELDFGIPEGFASFVLRATIPGRAELSDEACGELAQILGGPVRLVAGAVSTPRRGGPPGRDGVSEQGIGPLR